MMKRNLEQKGHRRFWWLLGVLLMMIMVRYAFQIDFPKVAFLAIIILIALLGDQNEIMAMCICLIPMHESVDFFYAIAIIIGTYVFKYHKQIRLGPQILLTFLVIVWELLHCFRSSFSVVEFLTYVIPFAVLAIVMASNMEELDYAFVIRAFAWAVLGISLVMLLRVLYFSGFNFLVAVANLQRMGSDLHSGIEETGVLGGAIHPNSLGIIAVLAATGLMQLRSMKVGRRSDMILMCVILVLAALGTSRTYLACLALMILLLIFDEPGGIKKKLQLIGILCLAVAGAAVAMAVIFPDTFEYYVSRFSVTDITTGRDSLMVLYHRFITNNTNVLFFGIGLQDYGNRLINYYRVTDNVPHNSLQEIVVAWGIVGLVIFSVLFLIMFRSAYRKNRKLRLINWIPLIILVFKSMAGQMLTSAYTMLALCLAYLSMCTDFTPKGQIDFLPAQKPESGN